MMLQPFPFQCSVSGCAPVVLLPGLQRPTAQTSAAPIAKTALKRLFPGPTLGVGTTLQVLPSQCSANVCYTRLPLTKVPTAHTSLGAIAATPVSRLRPPFMLRELTALQFELHGADDARGKVAPARLARPVVSGCWTDPILWLSGSAGIRLGAAT